MEYAHIPVLLKEVLEGLNVISGGTYVDGTLGGGGHAYEIAKRMQPDGLLIGIDQDICAIDAAKSKLTKYEDNIILVNDNFRNVKSIIESQGIEKVDGILFDLGVSSYQLDEGERGFSYMKDAKLDMRMDRNLKLNAESIINEWTEDEIARVIKDYGEERWAKRIASFIIKERLNKRITTTFELVEIIKNAIPASARREGPHPAKRTFQGIRIAVNDELASVEKAITDGVELLKTDGRICVITFHSLEDRIVKTIFNKLEKPCICPPKSPICTCKLVPKLKVITRKVIIADEQELNENPRSRSAKLRIAKRLGSNI